METSEHILCNTDGPVGKLTINRPDVHNALDIEMIRILTTSVQDLETRDEIRIIVLNSEGKHFSAGADLRWMKEAMSQSPQQLESESLELATLFRTIHLSNKTFLTLIQGKALGGANGLIAASDLVIADNSSSFAFSESRLGLVPATIAPYVMKKLGFGRTKELMLTGRSFSADEARSWGLVHQLCEEGTLEIAANEMINMLLSNGPESLIGIKRLLNWLDTNPTDEEILPQTAATIAKHRISPEGQEGLTSFFEKRKPNWDETI